MEHLETNLARLRFELTWLQRVANPFERIVYSIGGVGGAAFVAAIVLLARPEPLQCLVLGSAAALLLLVLWRPIYSLVRSMIGTLYVNTIAFSGSAIDIGPDGITTRWPRSVCRVSRGLFGAAVIRHAGGFSIVVPETAITLEQLRRLVGR